MPLLSTITLYEDVSPTSFQNLSTSDFGEPNQKAVFFQFIIELINRIIFPIIPLKFMICLIPFKTLPQYIIQYRVFFCLNIKQCKTYRKENSYRIFFKEKLSTQHHIQLQEQKRTRT